MIYLVLAIKLMPYKDQLVAGFWRYASSRNYPAGTLDHQVAGSRPPVFTPANADLNVLRAPGEHPERLSRLMDTVPRRNRQKWFRSMASSQALAQSVFGNLIVSDRLDLLSSVETEEGEPLIGPRPRSAELEFEVGFLGEPRKTSLDVVVTHSNGYRVAFECKLTELKVGTCSRPALKIADANYERDYCDGTFTCQRRRTERCSLTSVGVAYWRHVPGVFHWASDCDHMPCPLRETYQLVRNVLAVSVDRNGVLSPGNGHAVLIYDERNPAFGSDGAGRAAYEKTRGALREKNTLRKCSWQRILRHFREARDLRWLTDELFAKYGL